MASAASSGSPGPFTMRTAVLSTIADHAIGVPTKPPRPLQDTHAICPRPLQVLQRCRWRPRCVWPDPPHTSQRRSPRPAQRSQSHGISPSSARSARRPIGASAGRSRPSSAQQSIFGAVYPTGGLGAGRTGSTRTPRPSHTLVSEMRSVGSASIDAMSISVGESLVDGLSAWWDRTSASTSSRSVSGGGAASMARDAIRPRVRWQRSIASRRVTSRRGPA